MPGRPHHSPKMKECVDKVMAQGHDESSAYAICTTSLQEAGTPIYVNAEAFGQTFEELTSVNIRAAAVRPRREMYQGKEHLVVPVVALVEGVIHAINAETPEYVSTPALIRSAHTWNGRPLMVGHPTKNGRQISANDPEVMRTQAFGWVFASRAAGSRLGMEAWVDPDRLRALGQHVLLKDIESGKPIEISVGAHVKTLAKEGVFNGKRYLAEWVEMVGDHLAFLPGGRGACSVEMGCGCNRAAAAFEFKEEDIRALWSPDEHVEPKSLRQRVADLITAFRASDRYDTPEQAASEEAAELIGYKAIQSHIARGADALKEVSGLVADLISDETKNPTQTASQEEAETEVERARLQAIGSLLATVNSAVWSAQEMCARLSILDLPKPEDPRYAEALRTAIGRRNSSADEARIQAAHDTLVDLGAACGAERAAAKRKDCTACEGTGSKDGNPCDACNGSGYLKVAEAKAEETDSNIPTHERDTPAPDSVEERAAESASEGEKDVNDMTAEELDRALLAKAERADAEFRAACSCGEKKMTPEQKAELIKQLVVDKHSGFTAGDERMLEAASDERLESFRVAAEARANREAELRAAAERKLTPEEFKAAAPPELLRVLERQERMENDLRTALVTELKAAQGEYSEAELSVMPVESLQRLARIAKVDNKIDYTGRSGSFTRALSAGDTDDYTPPNPYESGLKALQAKVN